MRTAVGLEDGLGLDGDRCMRDTPTIPTNNFEVLKIFQTILKNKLYRVTCVCLVN